jgi:uncharacterized protein (DUF1778 family)
VSRFQAQTTANLTGRIDLADAEVRRLVEILDRGFSPTPAFREALSRLANPKRQPPHLHWKDDKA